MGCGVVCGQVLLYHLRQLNVCQAVDERLAEAGQLLQEAVVVLFDHPVFLLDCLQVTFHRGDLLSGTKREASTRAAPGFF